MKASDSAHLLPLLQKPLEDDYSAAGDESWQSALAAVIEESHHRLAGFRELPAAMRQECAQEAAWQLAERIDHWRKTLPKTEAENRVYELEKKVGTIIFFVPTMVSFLYSPQTDPSHPLVATGIDYHCRFFRRVVKQLLHKQAHTYQHLHVDFEALEDDLYSCALEEVVKLLSDSVARVWQAGQSAEPIIIPPSRRKGWKQTLIARVAFTPDGNRLTTLRADGLIAVWQFPEAVLHQTWQFSSLPDGSQPDSFHWPSPYFSRDGQRLAWQSSAHEIGMIHVDQPDAHIRYYRSDEKEAFMRDFGEAYLNHQRQENLNAFSLADRWNRAMPAQDYLARVYHWSANQAGDWLVTASEIERGMPLWMRDIGFQNAVYYMLKRRLIDFVRKETHGSSSKSEQGPQESSSEPEEQPSNAYLIEKPLDWLTAAEEAAHAQSPAVHDWREQHDLERILAALQEITITYKQKAISCEQLASLKAEGKTNAEIAETLDVPRGSVDYLWSQCKKQIQFIFGLDIT